LFSRSVANNTKTTEKVNHVYVTPIISRKENLYLLVLYVFPSRRQCECIHQCNHKGMCPKKIYNNLHWLIIL